MSVRRRLCSMLPVAVIGVLLVGCTGASTAASPTVVPPSPTPTVAPTGPFALRSGMLPPGDYVTTSFQPALAFTLDDGWRGLFPDDEDEVALERTDGALFAISRVSQVVDPTNGAAAVAPDDLVEWLATHPGLTAETPEAVTIGGLSGQVVDITVTEGPAREIFAFPSGNLRIPPGVTYRCHVLQLDGPDMTIIIGAPTDGFADVVAMVEPVLDSMVIDLGG